MTLPFPSSSELSIPLFEIKGSITLEEAVELMALLLNGQDAEQDGEVILGFCKTFNIPPAQLYLAILSRCQFPAKWTLH